MKTQIISLAFSSALLFSCNESKNIEHKPTQEATEKEAHISEQTEDLLRLLEANQITKAYDLIRESYDDRMDLSPLLSNCSHSRYNAKKIIDDGRILRLQGNFWIRSGDQLISGLADDDSYAVIHKKTMLLVEIGGEYEVSILLKNAVHRGTF